ncbi:A-kinase-interacting protein 1 [Thalassophryne amazonica]|uniref:A-kinase-interacting protein 1 n=1 Tax=Thalassophryne amazonica TaxID=390379 RepID=UPI001470C472|nr:A-kinase-interacting protein 1 [Thalassophryne amazonica]
MANQSWLEDSLLRSASLGQEVLERASKRRIDWTNTGVTHSSSSHAAENSQVKGTHTSLNDAFDTIAEFMTQTTCQCKRFYESGCCTEPTDAERSHVARFHTRPAGGRPTPRPPATTHKDCGHMLETGQDFHIDVSPGTYAVTARMPESQQQTQVVKIDAGESISLTFDLSPKQPCHP